MQSDGNTLLSKLIFTLMNPSSIISISHHHSLPSVTRHQHQTSYQQCQAATISQSCNHHRHDQQQFVTFTTTSTISSYTPTRDAISHCWLVGVSVGMSVGLSLKEHATNGDWPCCDMMVKHPNGSLLCYKSCPPSSS